MILGAHLWPTPDDNDAEFESLALIEFDQADLPWRYTPAAANASGQLRPWLTLLVFEEGEATITPPTPSLKQAVVTVQNGAALPDLAQAWAWAHTQFIGKNLSEAQLSSSIKRAPGKFASRILCARLLESNKSYTACLVPTFARGAALASNEPHRLLPRQAPAGRPRPDNLPSSVRDSVSEHPRSRAPMSAATLVRAVLSPSELSTSLRRAGAWPDGPTP